ncbi:MAG: hypothetical protein FJW39_17310 [Acidobacteria bacterium]|nr:hypothetical protein [Acidobacteriota bacterium]
MNTDHERIRKLLPLIAAGVEPEPPHLAECAGCRTELESWREAAHLLRTQPPIAAPPGLALRTRMAVAEARLQRENRWLTGLAVMLGVSAWLLFLATAWLIHRTSGTSIWSACLMASVLGSLTSLMAAGVVAAHRRGKETL